MRRSRAQSGGAARPPRESLLAIRQAGRWAQALLDDSAAPMVPGPGTVARAHPGTAASGRYANLVARGVISHGELARAHTLQDRTGGSILDILTSWPSVSTEAVARALALDTGLRYVDLRDADPPRRLAARLDRAVAMHHRFAPIGESALGTVVAVVDPFAADLRSVITLQIGGPFELVVATAADISQVLGRLFGADSIHSATARLAESNPQDSASVVVTSAQKLAAVAAVGSALVALIAAPVPTLIVLNASVTLFYLAAALFRLRLIQLATDPHLAGADGHDDQAFSDDVELPVYSILVPLYREAAVVGRISHALARLDYPPHRLDILLICEEDDDETIDAIDAMTLPAQFRLIVVPDSLPKTKPKACNYALDYARGEMAVIYDAEDAPDPDQLRRVVGVLAHSGDDVACVQARLSYANAEQNLLTRWFTAEYMMWFDLILPGLERIDAPIPLGGTSNHFRMSVLRELEGWDPFNVTEDADLGIRLYKRGYRTLNLDSTTYEEANSQVPNWIRQRSRWMKGHLQTWLVHNRNPARTRRELGWRGWIGFQMTIGASPICALLNPIFWLLLAVWLSTRLEILQQILPGYVYLLASVNLLVWNFVFVYAATVAVARRGSTFLVRSSLISPLYWVLISIATWKGALQLITKPFYWEKTVHGLDGGFTGSEAPR